MLADDPVAAEATCARLMGFDPTKIGHMKNACEFLGNYSVEKIDQLAESICIPRAPIQMVPEFKHLLLDEYAPRELLEHCPLVGALNMALSSAMDSGFLRFCTRSGRRPFTGVANP